MKAQITLFIIIGILVVVAFGIAFYVGNKVSKPQETKMELGIQPIQDYITTCLSLATIEGLSLIGRQGGAIYQSQGGLSPEVEEGNYVEYTDEKLGKLNVSFLILPPEGNVGTLFFSRPPKYPFEGFPYAGREPLFTGYYGISKLPPLYKFSNVTGNYVEGSIQENLETFIAKKTSECPSWQSFEEKGYDLTAGTAISSLLFANTTEQLRGEQNINVELLWPIEITTPDGEKALLEDFAIREQVRLATIYFTIKEIIDADVTDISYAPKDVGAFSVSVFPHGENSFVTVKDTQSIIGNKPFEFWIPRKNRRPALWRIDTDQLNKVTFHEHKDRGGAEITATATALRIDDPCQEPGIPKIYSIELNASDPDENEVYFESSKDEVKLPQPFSVRVYAKDGSTHTDDWFDSQEIQLQVALCKES